VCLATPGIRHAEADAGTGWQCRGRGCRLAAMAVRSCR
jgi:hypothetical protein